MLTALRFFAGCFGRPQANIGRTVVSDLFALETRGKAISWYQSGPIWAPHSVQLSEDSSRNGKDGEGVLDGVLLSMSTPVR